MSDEFDQPRGDDPEGRGWESVLNRCRVLAAKIANDLRNKSPEHFVDKLSLTDIHSSLERTADVLSTVKGSRAQGPQSDSATVEIPHSKFSAQPLVLRRIHQLSLNGGYGGGGHFFFLGAFWRVFGVDGRRCLRWILTPPRRSFKLRVLVDRQRPMKNV